LTPDTSSEYTWPPELKQELDAVAGSYEIDVADFRTENKAALLEDIHRVTGKHFATARHLMRTRHWHFFMMVEMGTDRIQHAFWKYFDPTHPRHDPQSPYRNAIRKYYERLDEYVGTLIALAGPRATVIVVSDHGAQAMHGGLCINEWLIAKGYLKLKSRPLAPRRLTAEDIDWSATSAWAEGGYYSRVFLNVTGREPQGIVAAAEYEAMRSRLAREISGICDENGTCLGSVCYRPEDVYTTCNNIPPDLIVYPGNLSWRSVGSVGMGGYLTYENDIGPDDANHGQYGIFIAAGNGVPVQGDAGQMDICDVAPTLLRLFDVADTPGIQGRSVL
jgi:predicted AlkP superfamily phosphohydrolase/phosphomutase